MAYHFCFHCDEPCNCGGSQEEGCDGCVECADDNFPPEEDDFYDDSDSDFDEYDYNYGDDFIDDDIDFGDELE